MSFGYVDTSVLVAIALGEPGSETLADELASFDHLMSSNLLEAEFRAALKREEVEGDPGGFLDIVDWVLPAEPLSSEVSAILEAGYGRGADVWHLACALWVHQRVGGVRFLTLDERQAALARAVGLP